MAAEQKDEAMVEGPEAAAAAGGSSTARSDDSDDVFFITLHYKGAAYEVPIQAGEAVSSIFDFVQEVMDFPRDNCKLICKGKLLRPEDAVQSESAASLKPGSKVMLMATSEHDISFVRNSRPDPLVKGFAEEERDERNRRKRAKAGQVSAWGTKQDQEYCFASIKAEFKYSTPSPYEAEALLKKLATDPGIIELMKTRQFRVGILTEMSPVEAQERMANRGTPNMDLLGYNQNAGDKIVLRLRTDSLKGFRPYHDLINTLIHELTHNVWGPHDHNFWKLYGELKAQYMKFHRFWSHGGRAADSNAAGQFDGFGGDDAEGPTEGGGFGQTLGGAVTNPLDAPLTAAERRARAAAAAATRKANPGSSMVEDEDEEVPAAGSQAGSGVVTFGGFDFLNSNGSWLIACPCGQQHPIDQCPEDFVASLQSDAPCVMDPAPAAAAAAETLTAEPMDLDDGKVADDVPMPPANPAAPVSVEAPVSQEGGSSSSTSPAPTATSAAPPAGDVAMTPAVADADIAGPQASATAADSVMAAEPAAPEPDNIGNAEPALSAEELEALGLDGASLWISRFSGKLGLLRRSSHPAAGTAVETLHRLVQNIIEHPQEQKFRRVKASNPKIQARLLGLGEDAEALMSLLGFEAIVEDGEKVFAIRDNTFDSVRLRLGQEVLERHLKEGSIVRAH